VVLVLTTTEISKGQFVKSKSGRDKDKIFIIIEIVDEVYVRIVDGDLRRVEKPKLKKIKHLAKMNRISDDIQQKLINERKITNQMIRREIEKLGMI
jgi:ribosomal protein L14E/L6E/L27E